HNGTIKEFSSGEDIVTGIADQFSLNREQREAVLERIYKKENRIVRTPLWHRLLYRAADSLATKKLITRPTDTMRLTNKKEWMLTEKGYDTALQLLHIPFSRKERLPVTSFEVQREIKKIKESPRPDDYDPFETAKPAKMGTRTSSIRSRSFRHAVIETYNYTCCVCGLKMSSPDSLSWEVEAAHIVPHSLKGKDDLWNGVTLCRFHHWAFDVGWFSFSDDYRIIVSSQFKDIPPDFGLIEGFDLFRNSLKPNKMILLPEHDMFKPHKNVIEWHRNNVFYP
ncbi:MAG: HNH endonuclease, partial [Treponema sp.]|nr:HNH endonuclease [Treponema sp.]